VTALDRDPQALRRLLTENPQIGMGWQRLGLVLGAAGDTGSAVTPLRRAVVISPRAGAVWESLGLASMALERWREAAIAYRAALALQPGRGDLAARLAEILARDGRPAEALDAFDLAVSLSPSDSRLRQARAVIRAALGDRRGAVGDLRAALADSPGSAQAQYALGQCLSGLKDQEGAGLRFRRTLALDDQAFEALINLGVLSQHLAEFGFGRRCLRRGLALMPENAEVHGNLGSLEMLLGRVGSAIRRTRRAVHLDPAWVDAHSNLLLALGYTEMANAPYFAEHRHWEARHATPIPVPPHDNDRDPDRRLRVGYLSADFYDHSLGTNIAGLIQYHDHAEVEVHCYAELERPDDMTRHIRVTANHFVETQGLDDAALAERIRADRIDVLMILAGHTARNRLTVAARKPAPIMVSYGDFSTTGLAAMDYWLTDPIVHPPDATQELFTERLMRIPMMVLHRPIDVAPPVSALPAPERGHVTFGSYNNPAKIGRSVISLWARVLARVPESRLILKYRTVFEIADVRDRIHRLFAEQGIPPGRVLFIGGNPNRARHLGLVGEMDIALDPFPFNGCTTTFEALWMGVPVVTLAGTRFLGRMGASFLTHLGLPDLVAADADAYVEAAAKLAADLPRLADLRLTMRERILASPLCDGPAYARSIEAAYRVAWREWCGAMR
jgi:protein O-GlcNAc transferase